jgi:hypothetical protein
MSERYVVVSNVVEEVYLLLLEEKSSCNGVNRCVTPTLIEKSTILVKGFEVVGIGLGSEPVEVADFEIRPLLVVSRALDFHWKLSHHVAMVVGLSTVITEESHGVVLRNVFWVILHELLYAVPKSRDRLYVFVQTQHEAVLLLVVGHEFENVIIDIAEHLYTWLNTPVPFIVQHKWLFEEESRLKATHVTIAYRVAVDDLFLSHILTDLRSFFLVNVRGE